MSRSSSQPTPSAPPPPPPEAEEAGGVAAAAATVTVELFVEVLPNESVTVRLTVNAPAAVGSKLSVLVPWPEVIVTPVVPAFVTAHV